MTEAKNLKELHDNLPNWSLDMEEDNTMKGGARTAIWKVNDLIKDRIKELEEHKESFSLVKTREDGSQYQEVRLHKREGLCPECGAISELKRLLGEE